MISFKKIAMLSLLVATGLNTTNVNAAQNDISWKSLDLKNALVFKKGNGSRVVGVITDIDCGYCKVLEKELQSVNDVTVYQFVTPIKGNTSQAISIWCAKNPNDAFLQKMLANKPPVIASCKNPIQQNLQLVDKYNVIGTPMIIKPNGQYIYGALKKDQIEGFLQ